MWMLYFTLANYHCVFFTCFLITLNYSNQEIVLNNVSMNFMKQTTNKDEFCEFFCKLKDLNRT